MSASQGQATITLTSPAGSLLYPRIRVFDSNRQPVADLGGQFFVTGPDQQVSTAVFKFTATRNARYYVQVEGVPPFGNTFKTAETGAYTLDFNAPIPDDHPNVGEFTLADPIVISPFSGDGSANGTLEIGTDTDLFKFVSVANGTMVVTLTSPGNLFRPFVRFFDRAGVEIGTAVRDGGVGDEDGQLNGAVKAHAPGHDPGHDLLRAGLFGPDRADKPPDRRVHLPAQRHRAAPGPDDHPDAGDYSIATVIPLDLVSGDATQTGIIEVPSDTDLFVFNSLAGSAGSPRTSVHPGGHARGRHAGCGRADLQERQRERGADRVGHGGRPGHQRPGPVRHRCGEHQVLDRG